MVRALLTAAVIAAAMNWAPAASADPLADPMSFRPPGYSEGSCRPVDVGNPGALAAVDCASNSLPGGPMLARYASFPDRSALDPFFAANYQSHHFEAATCPGTQDISPSSWISSDGTRGGLIVCGAVEGDFAAVMWTKDSGPLFGLAVGSDLSALLEGGPHRQNPAWRSARPAIAPLDDPVMPGIAGTSWRFVEIMGATPPATVQPTLELSADGAAKGNSGCNDFSGRYVSAGADLTFSDIAYTKMLCAAEVMTVERAVQSALTRTSRMATAPGELDLVAPDGTVLARLAAVT